MLIAIWDWLLTRRTWTVIKQINVHETDKDNLPCGRLYIMQDQFGNIKRKRINF